MSTGLEVITPGLMTSVQDRGRFGFQALGISVSGALDPDGFDLANALAGNEAGTGALDKDPDLREAEEQASRDIGLGVEIRGSATRGHVRISYASLEQLELVLARLAGK